MNERFRAGHEFFPDKRGERTAGYFVHRRAVVIADPDAGDEILCEADEPGIAVFFACAGFARGEAIERRLAARALLDDALKKLDQLGLVWTERLSSGS